MKYIYITNSPFNQRDANRFGINFFLEKGFNVIVVDVTAYTNPELREVQNKLYTINNCNFEMFCIQKFKDFKNLENVLQSGDIALTALGYDFKSIKIRNYLRKKNIKIGTIRAALLPSLQYSKQEKFNKFGKILTKIYQTKLSFIFSKIFGICYKKIFEIDSYDFLITSNWDTFKNNNNDLPSKTIIETHSLDCDRVLEIKNKEYENDGKYVVFLDQYLTEHTDFIRMGTSFPVTKEKYFQALHKFFKMIEVRYNYEIIIALHPRANDEYKNLFKNYKTEILKSELLVKNSEFVITHFSTAINFAIIYNKPIYFVITDEMKDIYQSTREAKCYAAELGRSCINIDKIDSLPLIEPVDEKKYTEYTEKYIKKSSIPNIPIWEQFYKEYILSCTKENK